MLTCLIKGLLSLFSREWIWRRLELRQGDSAIGSREWPGPSLFSALPANSIPKKFNQGMGFNLQITEFTLGISGARGWRQGICAFWVAGAAVRRTSLARELRLSYEAGKSGSLCQPLAPRSHLLSHLRNCWLQDHPTPARSDQPNGYPTSSPLNILPDSSHPRN